MKQESLEIIHFLSAFTQNKHGGWPWECNTSLLHQQSWEKLP